ncbi:MAG: TIGR00159 family protein [Porphyromonadaceae bacterium CG2_30_38_12]|nr:MAG: TIGR00159 family protein [Porphyromonadaceae bacterium CG2_30_38_12]
MGFQITFKDFVDIFLVAVLLFQLYKLLKRTGAVNVFLGVLAFLSFWIIVRYVFNMELLGGIMDRIVSVGAFALIVLFQDEIRRFFSKIGSKQKWSVLQFFKKIFSPNAVEQNNTDFHLLQIVLACRGLSKTATGGLIVIRRDTDLDSYVQSGEQINAIISSRLIENIFFKNSPLHDGAMIINKQSITAAACILPVSKNQSIPKRLGLRHRAALGITENTDAIAIIVSEETGHISWAMNGVLTSNVKSEELEHFLSEELTIKNKAQIN